MLKERNGERQHVCDSLEVVVYSKLGIPGFTNDFEINFGGMRFNPGIDYKCNERVIVRLFMENIAVLDLYGMYLRSEDDETSVVTFEPLSDKQRLIFIGILEQANR